MKLDLGKVLVNDSLAPKPLQRRITRLMQQPIWQYGWRSNPRRDRFAYWHVHFAGGEYDSRVDCEPELASIPEIKAVHELWKLLEAGHLKGHVPLRVYANGHTFGSEDRIHVDNPDTKSYFTTVYYAHSDWHTDWSGETVFYTQDRKEIIASVYPKPGRAVTFHGAVLHCARPAGFARTYAFRS